MISGQRISYKLYNYENSISNVFVIIVHKNYSFYSHNCITYRKFSAQISSAPIAMSTYALMTVLTQVLNLTKDNNDDKVKIIFMIFINLISNFLFIQFLFDQIILSWILPYVIYNIFVLSPLLL